MVRKDGSLWHVDEFGGESKGEMSVFVMENSARSVKGEGKWRCIQR